jgi:hypothetical protein
MITRYKFLDFLIWSVLRLLIYSFLLSFVAYNYNDLPKYALEFKNQMKDAAKYSNFTWPDYINKQLIHPIPIFKKFLFICLICSVLATFGFKLFQFISGILVFVIDFLKYHPLKPPEVSEGESYEALSQKYPWIDTILIGVFGIIMIIHSLVEIPEDWILEKDSNKIEAVLEEDTEEYKKKQMEKEQKKGKKKKD